jgi:hypothetical protein
LVQLSDEPLSSSGNGTRGRLPRGVRPLAGLKRTGAVLSHACRDRRPNRMRADPSIVQEPCMRSVMGGVKERAYALKFAGLGRGLAKREAE